jgi:RNA polymerase sigma-70 factor (ECF subfamily)
MQASRLERCARLCSERAWRLAYALLRDADAAYDAVQQAFLVAATKPDRVPEDDPWPWFSVVLTHEIRNLRRKRRPATNRLHATPDGGEMDRPDPRSATPDDAASGAEESSLLWKALDGLPAPEREALVLVHVGGLTHAGAAEALGVPRQTITERARRGLETLSIRMRRDPSVAARALAIVPVVLPPGGLVEATAAWTKAAVSAAATTGASATTTVVGGGIVAMSTKAIWALTVSAGVGLGFWGGATEGFGVLGPGGARSARGETPSRPLVAAATPEAPDAAPSLAAAPGISGADALRLRAENARLGERLAAVERELASVKAVAARPAGPKDGPVFTFGEVGALDAVHEADWRGLGAASLVVGGAVVEIFRHAEAGTEVPRETYLRLQENVEKMRTYEYRTIDRIPTAARHNGEFTHPVTHANLLASVLSQRGTPLTPAQVEEIERLGLAFDRDFARVREGWGPDVPRARRMLEEYRLKGRFCDDLWALLTEAQRPAWVEPGLRGLAGLDLYDPTLMILHTTAVLTGQDLAEVRAKTLQRVRKALDLDATTPAPQIEGPVDAFLARTARGLDPVPSPQARYYSYADGSRCGEASAELVDALLADPGLSPAVRRALLDDPTWYLPRLVAP